MASIFASRLGLLGLISAAAQVSTPEWAEPPRSELNLRATRADSRDLIADSSRRAVVSKSSREVRRSKVD